MPFCIGFAAALLALGGNLQASGGAPDRAAASAACWALLLFSGLVDAAHRRRSRAIRCFPISTNIGARRWRWRAPYRDMRFVPTHFWREVFFPVPVLDRLACRRRSGLSGYPRLRRLFHRDRRRSLIWLFRRESSDPLFDKRVTLPLFAFAALPAISSGCRFFAIYRYIIVLEMLAPAPDRGGGGAFSAGAADPLSDAGGALLRHPGHGAQRFPGAGAGGGSLYPGGAAAHSPIPTRPWC